LYEQESMEASKNGTRRRRIGCDGSGSLIKFVPI